MTLKKQSKLGGRQPLSYLQKGRDAEQAYCALISLASEKLGRVLTEEEERVIRRLDSRHVAGGYHAERWRRLSQQELSDCLESIAKTRAQLDEIEMQSANITPSQLKKGRVDLATVISDRLARPLSANEEKVIQVLDKWLVVWGDLTGHFRRLSQKEILDFFAECEAGSGINLLLTALATDECNLKLNRERLMEFLSPRGRTVMREFDFESTVTDFSRWLLDALQAEPPAKGTRALYFGLSETTGGGCMLSISGAKNYDEEDSDWACSCEWGPAARFAILGPKIWKALRRAGEEPWVVALGIATVIVRIFFENHHAAFTRLTRLSLIHITCGFVDGDLYVLRTPISTRA